jgi:DNA-directed RNA polymerase specialized sigma24 family protein
VGLGQDAIVDLYRRLRPRLANFFLRRTRDREAAIDLVGETFARADALHLRVVQELDYAVVARRLGVTEATARARVSRGLRKLAESLDRDAEYVSSKRCGRGQPA